MTRVLAVDDDKRALLKIQKIVLGAGGVTKMVHVQRADEAREVLDSALVDFRPEFCIVDAHFGSHTDGVTVISSIRKWSTDMPVVLLSGFLDDHRSRNTILSIYQRIRHVQILSKNPFPTWKDFCRAAGLPQERSN